VANVIILISKMAKNGEKCRMCGVFFSFSEKKKSSFCEIFEIFLKKKLYIFVGLEKRK